MRARRWSAKSIGFVVALVAGLAVVAVWWGYPAVIRELDRRRMVEILVEMRALQQAISLKILDDAGKGGFGLPADIGAKTAKDYLTPLVADGYLDRTTLDRMLERISVVNVSKSDPPDTPLLLYGRKDGEGSRETFAIYRVGGGGGVFKRETDWSTYEEPRLPRREPQILPGE